MPLPGRCRAKSCDRANVWWRIAVGIFSAQEHNEADKRTIGAVVGRFMDAWNGHDAHAVAELFSEDADFTNVRGTHVRRRTALETFLVPPFAGNFKESHLTGRLRSLRFLKPDVAMADIDWEMTGATTPAGLDRPLHKGLLDWALTKTRGTVADYRIAQRGLHWPGGSSSPLRQSILTTPLVAPQLQSETPEVTHDTPAVSNYGKPGGNWRIRVGWRDSMERKARRVDCDTTRQS
jgi:uncharacterized protein (TIGR02246 family)